MITSINNNVEGTYDACGLCGGRRQWYHAIDLTVAGAASDVGLQIGWGLNSQTPTPIDFATGPAMTLPKDGSSTIRFR
ncbi:hypothetical protein ACQ86O_01620 [Serratia sp. L9]|uniref:hypothetical protein n=1 Tax=Serratia sp. L9 TaxID=3423946 RepID=UPI003D666FDE